METKKTVVFDDGCPTCTVGKDFAESHDAQKALTFVGMNTEEGKVLIEKHNLDMNASAYVLREDGSRAAKSEMIREVLAHNGLLGFVFSVPFRVPYLSDMLYDLLALHRKHVTRSSTSGTTNRLP